MRKIEFNSNEGRELTNRSIRRSTTRALWMHKLAGNPIATSDANGGVKIVQPEDIKVPNEFDENSNDDAMVNSMTNEYCVNAAIVYDLQDAREEIDAAL